MPSKPSDNARGDTRTFTAFELIAPHELRVLVRVLHKMSAVLMRDMPEQGR